MKNLFILFFGVVATTLFSQQCYIDATLWATDGERGKAVSYIFSDDFKYAMNTIESSEEMSVILLEWKGNKAVSNFDRFKETFEKYEDYIDYQQDDGWFYSRMKKIECGLEIKDIFKQKLSEMDD